MTSTRPTRSGHAPAPARRGRTGRAPAEPPAPRPEPRTPARGTAGAAKLASQVAEAVQRDIAAAGWPVGESLGSESDLVERYGVSRTVLREAVRLLEHRQVAVMRMGPGGGLTVRRPEVGAVVTAAVVHLQYVGVTLDHLVAARAVLEPLAAGLAADAASEDDVAALRDALDAEAATDPATKAGPAQDALSGLIAQASGNPALGLFLEVVLQLTARYASFPGDRGDDVLAAAQQVEIGHGSVVAAIAAGDASSATHRARRHLELSAARLRPRPPSSGLAVGGADAKLAERVADAIHARVLAEGWPVGALLGAEADLLAEHGVSRAVLREAVRLLEHHRVAAMRRGRNGGLVVTAPDERACIDTAALYLACAGTDLDTLRVPRRAVELACVDLVVDRVAAQGADEVQELLRRTLEHERTCYEAGRGAFDCDVHAELSRLCGNPVLGLFSRVLSVLWAREVQLREFTFDWRTAAADVLGVHAKIVEAITTGDADVARRRMAKHVDALDAWWR